MEKHEVAIQQTGGGAAVAARPAVGGLTEHEAKLAAAFRSERRVVDVLRTEAGLQELHRVLNVHIHKSQVWTGVDLGKESTSYKNLLVQELMKELSRYRWLKVEEVPLVLERGMLGDYGDYVNLNRLNLRRWVLAFRRDKRRVAAIRKAEKDDEATPPSAAARRAMSERATAVRLSWLWELVCDLAILDTHADRVAALKHSSSPLQAWHHDWLLEKGILSYTEEEKLVAWRWACENCKLEDFLGSAMDLRKAAGALRQHRASVAKVRLVETFLLGAFRSGVDVPALLRPYTVSSEQ